MSDDIVARLRGHIAPTTQYANTRITPDLAEDISGSLDIAENEIVREAAARVAELEDARMGDDIVARLRLYSQRMKETRSTVLGLLLSDSADEIERRRSIVNEYDRDRVEYCSKWLQWIKDHDRLDVMEWMMAYSNAIPAPHPDGDAPTEIHAAIDARSREAAMEIERLRTRVAELEDIVAGRRPVL